MRCVVVVCSENVFDAPAHRSLNFHLSTVIFIIELLLVCVQTGKNIEFIYNSMLIALLLAIVFWCTYDAPDTYTQADRQLCARYI